MWKKHYQDKLKEMEQDRVFYPGFEDIPVYYDEYSDELSDNFDMDDLYDEHKQLAKVVEEQKMTLRKRKREDDDDGAEGHIIKKQRPNFKTEEKLEEDLIEIIEEDPIVEKPSRVSKWIEENMPYKEDSPIVKQMREMGLLDKDEKVISWTNPNPCSEDPHWDIILPVDQSFGEPSTEDDDTGVYLKKISLKKASDKIPPSKKDDNAEMEEKPGSHILAKDLNRRIVLKKK